MLALISVGLTSVGLARAGLTRAGLASAGLTIVGLTSRRTLILSHLSYDVRHARRHVYRCTCRHGCSDVQQICAWTCV